MEYQHDMNWERSMIRNMKHDTWDGMVGQGAGHSSFTGDTCGQAVNCLTGIS